MASFVFLLTVTTWIVYIIPSSLAATTTRCTDNHFLNCSMLSPEACAHDCVAQELCPGYCNTCRRKCYHCDAVDRPEDCHTTAVCQSNQVCIVTQTFTQSLVEKFQLGCVDKSICTSLYGGIQSKRSISFDGGCCDHNYCNKHDPDVSTLSPITEQVTSPLPSPLDLCQDIDANFCAYGGHKECYIPCFANMCPVTCKKCMQCRSCNEVDSVQDCSHTKVCEDSEVCIATETRSSNFQRKIKLDCVSRAACNHLNLTVTESRDPSITGHVDGYCCNTTDCNSKPLPAPETTTTPLPTTTLNPEANPSCHRVIHDCPHNYHKLPTYLSSSCYLFTTTKHTFEDARKGCLHSCARPVIISTTDEARALTQHILQNHNLVGPFWTDGTRTHDHSHWTWRSSYHDVMTSLFSTEVHHGRCLVFGREASSAPFTDHHFYADGRECSESYNMICEILLN
ncbi:uncharacterized protein LOC111120750 isoform X2 [Crassostrea virginica]